MRRRIAEPFLERVPTRGIAALNDQTEPSGLGGPGGACRKSKELAAPMRLGTPGRLTARAARKPRRGRGDLPPAGPSDDDPELRVVVALNAQESDVYPAQ
eukprot:7320277-Pyramimonas_sp.AAC.1